MRLGLLLRPPNERVVLDPPPVPNRAEHPFVGTIMFQGIIVYVETAKGQTRSGVDETGRKWSVKMPYHYGELPWTHGADGEPIDVCVGDDPNAPMAYVIQQKFFHSTEEQVEGSFDESKVFLGYESRDAALKAYATAYDHAVLTPGVEEMSVNELRRRIMQGDFLLGAALSKSGGPFIGPKGGKWADAAHTIPYTEPTAAEPVYFPVHAAIAHDKLNEHAGDWVFRGNAESKKKLIETYEALPQRQRDMLAIEVKRAMPGKVTVYRSMRPGQSLDAMGGMSVSDERKGRTGNEVHKWEISPDDVMLHYKQAASWLGSKQYAHEHEIILKPDAKPRYLGRADDDLSKSETAHPPAGFTIIPGGKHGGYRRKRGTGWEYWYPGQHDHTAHPAWEHDLSRRVADLKAGDLVHVLGREGVYRFTPEHGKVGEGRAWVTSEVTHQHEIVRTSALQPIKPQAKKPKIPPPPVVSKPKKGGKKAPPLPPEPPKPPKPPPSTPQQGEELGSESARRSTPWKATKAKPGTALHALESGEHMIARYADKTGGWRDGVRMPDSEMGKLLRELDPLVKGIAKKAATRRGIEWKGEARRDLLSAAQEGVYFAITHYTGGTSFERTARDYAAVHTEMEARQLFSPVHVADSKMRLLHGFLAARARARKSRVKEPSANAVAHEWRLKKGDIFRGDRKLGYYTDSEGTLINQSTEEVPHEPWLVRDTTGKEHGDLRPGKLMLAETLADIAEGKRVQDSEWMQEHPEALPVIDTEMPTGAALHLREEVDVILPMLKPDHEQALKMRFGFPPFDDRDTATGDSRGYDLAEIADHLHLADGKSDVTKRREAGLLLEAASEEFKAVAKQRRSESEKYITRWTNEPIPAQMPATYRPSGRQLLDRFGNEERVAIYEHALRGGTGERTAKILEAEREGTASAEDSALVRREYHRQRDRDRLAAFRRATQHRGEYPEFVHDFGPGGDVGTPGDAEHLYPDDVIAAMTAAIKHGGGKT